MRNEAGNHGKRITQQGRKNAGKYNRPFALWRHFTVLLKLDRIQFGNPKWFYNSKSPNVHKKAKF